MQDVSNGGPGLGCDKTNALRMPGNRTLALGGKKPFCLQLLLEALKCLLQRAHPLQLHREDTQLILAALLVHGERAVEHDLLAVGEQIPVGQKFATKEDATELGISVLEREVNMPGALCAQVAQFAGDPNLPHLLFQQRPDVCSQLADGEHAPSARLLKQFAELPLRFDFFAHELAGRLRFPRLRHALNIQRSTRAVINFDNHSLQIDALPGDGETLRCIREEARNDWLNFTSENALMGTRESRITKIGGAARENLIVSGLDVSVRADHGAD